MVADERPNQEVPWHRSDASSDSRERTESAARDNSDSSFSTKIPWRNKTRQEEGKATESRILKARGARQHPRSGAGRIKEDGSTEGELIEVKDANKSFTLNAADLRQTKKRAAQQGKQGMWLIKFPGFVLECRIQPELGEEMS